MATCLDIQNAFNCLRHDYIIKTLVSLGTSEYLVSFIRSYLENQSVTTEFGVHGASIALQVGVPQGSRLGPLIFTACITRLIESLRTIEGVDCVVTAYADDLTIILSGPTRKHIRALWARVKKRLNKWCEVSGLSIDMEKSSCLSPRKPPHFSLKGKVLRRSKTVRVLGVHLDQRMNFRFHVKKTCETAIQRLGRLRRLGVERAALSSRGILATYEKSIVPYISYSVQSWQEALKEEWCQKLLSKVTAFAARMATKAPRRAANSAVIALSGLTPPHLVLAGLAARAEAREHQRISLRGFLNDGGTPELRITEGWHLHPLAPWDGGLNIVIQTTEAATAFACLAPSNRAIFTDGSLTSSVHAGAAIAVYSDGDEIFREDYRLPDHCTISQCEMVALERADKQSGAR